MISFIKGNLEVKAPKQIIIATDTVGYSINIPFSTFEKLPEVGIETKIHTYLHVREDALLLYGFFTIEEKQAFELLLSVTGIGPKIALDVLSGISVVNFKSAILNKNVSAFDGISGVGKKTAERIILELKDKVINLKVDVQDAESSVIFDTSVKQDAISALIALGYVPASVKNVMSNLEKELDEKATVQDIIKSALRYL